MIYTQLNPTSEISWFNHSSCSRRGYLGHNAVNVADFNRQPPSNKCDKTSPLKREGVRIKRAEEKKVNEENEGTCVCLEDRE